MSHGLEISSPQALVIEDSHSGVIAIEINQLLRTDFKSRLLIGRSRQLAADGKSWHVGSPGKPPREKARC